MLLVSMAPMKAQTSGGGSGGGWGDPAGTITIWWFTQTDAGWLYEAYWMLVGWLGIPLICWPEGTPECP